jgi:Ubiquitin-conjugating enzyme
MDRSLIVTRNRQWAGLVLLLAVLGSFVGNTVATTRHRSPFVFSRKISLSALEYKHQHQKQIQTSLPEGQTFDWSLLLDKLRGGDDEIELDAKSASPILTKVRNIIRSVLRIGDRKAPALSKLVKIVVKGMETVFGVELLPKKETIKRDKKAQKKKTKKMAKKTEEDEQDGTSTTTTAAETSSTANVAIKKHLGTKMLTTNPNYRIQRELKEFVLEPPPNLSVKVGKNIRVWIVTMEGAKNTIYEGEVFKLRISFPQTYPTMPPSVYFLPPNIP